LEKCLKKKRNNEEEEYKRKLKTKERGKRNNN